jgi:pimeloyl-ACP methyl ester carboxylesterase
MRGFGVEFPRSRAKLVAMSKAALSVAIVALMAVIPARADDAGHWTTVNGHRMYYEVYGKGRPMLLLHGGGNNIMRSWRRQIVDFAPTHEVIAPEQIGNGHTPDLPGPFSYARMTEDTAELLRQLHLKEVDVVGWSDGGIIALMLAIRYPDLIRRVVATGVNTDPGAFSSADLAGIRATPAADMVTGDVLKDYDSYSADGPGHALVVGEKLKQLWLTHPVPSELSMDLLHKVRARVLVMAGDHDAIPLEHVLQIYHALPNAELWILPDTGHGTFVERPDWTDPMVLSFLK